MIYINDLLPNFKNNVVKYADDTTVLMPVYKQDTSSTMQAILEETEEWSNDNHIAINPSKTVLLNICYKKPQTDINNINLSITNTSLTTSFNVKLLGVLLDERLSFTSHIDWIVQRCNSKLYLLRKLRQFGLSIDGLILFYFSNIRSIMTYACPAWCTIISGTDFSKLDAVQRKATKAILPHIDSYTERLQILNIPKLEDFITSHAFNHFCKILSDPSHPLFAHLHFNNNRKSSRNNKTFKRPMAHTAKRDNTFFNYFMKYYDER